MKILYSLALAFLLGLLANCIADDPAAKTAQNDSDYYYSVKFNGKSLYSARNAENSVYVSTYHGSSMYNDSMLLYQGSMFSKYDENWKVTGNLFGICLSKFAKEKYDSLDFITIFNKATWLYGSKDDFMTGAEITFRDEKGQNWSTFNKPGAQDRGNYFRILEITRKPTDQYDNTIFNIKVSFRCSVYNDKGKKASLEGNCRTRICVLDSE